MPATVAHVFTNNVPNATGTVTYFDFAAPGSTNTVPATSIVRPTDWNETHLVTLAPTGEEMLGGFSNGGNVSFGTNPSGFITASAPAGGGGGGIANAAGTQTGTSGTIVFSNSNNITFGMSNSSVITASASFNQSVQPAVQSLNGSSGAISLNVGSSLSASTNGSSITFGLASNITTALQSAGAYLTTAAQSNHSHNFATTTTGGANIVVGTTNSAGATIGVPAYLTTAMQSNAATISNINVSAGTTSNNLSAFTFSNGSGVSFGLNGSVITASVAAAGGAQTGVSGISAGTTQATSGTVSFADGNGVSFGVNGNTLTASVAAQSVQTQNMVSIQGSTNNISFGNANGITFGGNASTITASHNGLTSQSNQNITAANGGFAFQTLSFSNLNGISFGTSAGSAITASHNGLTTAAQSNHSHNFATTTTNGSLIVVATTNSAGATIAVPPYLTTSPAQSNQTGNLYVTANSTQLSSSAGIDLRSLSFAGAGIASVGVSNGVVLVSVPSGGGAGDGVNIVQMGTTGTTGTTFSASTGTVFINGGNNITVSQNASNQIVISAAQGGIAAGSQTATSGTLVFANSNGVTFGMSGSSQITASVDAGGAPSITYLTYQNRQLGASGSTQFTNNQIWMVPFRVAGGYVSASTLQYMQSLSGTFTSAAAATHAQTMKWCIYSAHTTDTTRFDTYRSGSFTWQVWNSGTSSGSWAMNGSTSSSAGTAVLTQAAGVRVMQVPHGSTISAGLYVMALAASSSSAGYSGLFSRYGMVVDSPMPLANGNGFGSATATSIGYVDAGTYSVTSAGFPSSIGFSEIRQHSNLVPYFKFGAV